MAVVLVLVSNRSNDIICLISWTCEYHDICCSEQCKNSFDLRTKIVWHAVALSLVLGIYLLTEAPSDIGRDHHRGIRILIGNSLQELRHSEYCIHGRTIAGRHLWYRIEHAIDEIVGIDDKEGFRHI